MANSSIPRSDGKDTPAYVVGEANKSAVIVIQEWWGLNENMKKIADRFAAAGFRAVVPDLYRGKVAKDATEAHELMTSLDWQNALQDLQAAVDWLRKTGSPKVGVTGFCLGGALTIATLAKVAGVDAGVPFYGIPDSVNPADVKVPFLGHFALKDDWCTKEKVQKFEQGLKDSGHNNFEVHFYDADHAFCNENRPEVYDAKSAQTAFDRTMRYFGAKL
eukprot:TRINITY_DN3721_c0_g1_i1.p1 TRINITY_DN3721_c0_g1~~TRINITY_DN3721_c0_g1_i1.p1  ORF type:complete len:218 (-),score=54.83 TRINITY_DN3721_c0_g1_i1:80-733(-)